MGIQTKILTQGDTLIGLASSFLGDASKWEEIAILNNLDYPFIVPPDYEPYGEESVLRIGQEIHLPVDVKPTSVIEPDKYGDGGLGIDIKVLPNSVAFSTIFTEGQIVATNGDVQMAVGIDCLKQDILHRLLTPKGSIPWHPDYGSEIPDLIGAKMTPENLEIIQVSAQECIYGDDRIEDIPDMSAYTHNTQVWLAFRAIVSSGDTLEFNEQIGGL